MRKNAVIVASFVYFAANRDQVLPQGIPRAAVEAGVPDFWRKYVGLDGAVVGIARFGESAPGAEVLKHFGFTAENVAAAVRKVFGEVSIV